MAIFIHIKFIHINGTGNDVTLDVEIALPLRYLDTFPRTLKMPLINCEINLFLTWSANCDICEVDKITTFAITDTKLYGPVVTLSTKDNTNLWNN